MKGRRIAIVGGVAGGAGAATRARRMDEYAEVVVFERGPYVSFANCGLPYYVGQDIVDRETLLLQTPQDFRNRFGIDVRTGHEAVDIDPGHRTLLVRGPGGHESVEYDALVLAPGARPIALPALEMGAENVFGIHTVPDADRLMAFLGRRSGTRAAVVGSGFIGLEMVEALLGHGVDVTLIERERQVLPPFDAEMTTHLRLHLEAMGVRVLIGDAVQDADIATGDDGQPIVRALRLASGNLVPIDFAVIAAGVRPDVTLATRAGLRLGPTGAIHVDSELRTSQETIWAAGDAVEKRDRVTGREAWWALAGPANKEARVAGTNAAGGHRVMPASLGTAIVRVEGLTAAKTGLSARDAKRLGIRFRETVTVNGHHASYYPGAEDLVIKLVSDWATGRVLGAQVIGRSGVDKRVDVIATAITAQMKVLDLADLDLAYAPPFASAKDPVVMAGMVAENALRGEIGSVTPDELDRMLGTPGAVTLLDVRRDDEKAEGAIPGAMHIPLDQLRERADEVPGDRTVVVYCRSGHRSYIAVRLLAQRGSPAINLTGGYLYWQAWQGSKAAPGPRASGDAVPVAGPTGA